MDTQRLNATPENGESGSESKMCAKAKKIVGKTACFAGTAGLGVVGTMAVQAINITEDSDTAIGDVTSTSPTFSGGDIGEVVETTVTDFDPNDIMIVEVEEVPVANVAEIQTNDTAQGTHHSTLASSIEPQPITAENRENPESVDNLIANIDTPDEIDPTIEIDCVEIDGKEIYVGPDDCEELVDYSEELFWSGDDDLAVGDDLSVPDVLDDILNI